MRQDPSLKKGLRASALWGKRTSGSRSSALWGKGGRGSALLMVLVIALTAPMAATAGGGKKGNSGLRSSGFYASPGLLAEAKANPEAVFNVIVQADAGHSSAGIASNVRSELSRKRGKAKGLKHQFRSVSAVAANLTGEQIVRLARRSGIRSITRDARVTLSDYYNSQVWVQTVEATSYWNRASQVTPPTIAIVDSGVEGVRENFGGRLAARVNLCSCTGNSWGDGRGHGTMVAGIAASHSDNFAGAAPDAKLVSIDVMDDRGMAFTSDVIAAADWILANKARYNIRVANFSLHSTTPTSFMFDPLDRAVEKLWFAGVVVVTAAGNYAETGQPSGVLYAPANDPFVITVGAADTANTATHLDDFAAPWSAYGYTPDGFAKPELGAPGRYMVGAVPEDSTMARAYPDRIVQRGFMWMSGTSFAAPVVAGAAAAVLADHPDWTPDQVKGALMLSATPAAVPSPAMGVGIVQLNKAMDVLSPPNPNVALNQFVKNDPLTGAPVFDAASWASTAQANASWNSASWASANWASANWASANWASASWAAANWASASWSSASWAAASWAQ